MTGESNQTGGPPALPASAVLPFAKRFGHAFLGSAAFVLAFTVITLQDIMLGMYGYVTVTTEFLNWLHLDVVAEDVNAMLAASMEIALSLIATWAAIMAAGAALLIAACVRRGGRLTFLLLGLLLPALIVGGLQAA